MDDVDSRTTRILFDLQACQVPGFSGRGISRYSQSLFENIYDNCYPRQSYALISESLNNTVSVLPVDQSRIIRLPELTAWKSPGDYQGGCRDSLNSVVYSSHVQTINPDVVHVSHFLLDHHDAVAVPKAGNLAQGQVLAATLYDLIPLLFQEKYLADSTTRKRYFGQLNRIHQFDLLLAISESTRQDAISHLGISPERVVTIHGGVSGRFIPKGNDNIERISLSDRFPAIREKYVLYTGGDDFRKNLPGAISGFAEIPPDTRKQTSLVIACSMTDRTVRECERLGQKLGLEADQLLFTRQVSDEDLLSLYQNCDLFMFPSLYEGLGLPILEAMACGAPVIGSNNSSIRELINRDDALFDPADCKSIAAAIVPILEDGQYANELREYGLRRAKEYSWERTAAIAMEALDNSLAKKKRASIQIAVGGWLPRKRMAYFSPLPPCRSGIADYSAQFLPHLGRHFDIDIYVDGYLVEDEKINTSFSIFDARDFENAADAYDVIFYEFGNSDFHGYLLSTLKRFTGVVCLHDAYLSDLFFWREFGLNEEGVFYNEMLYSHGNLARRYLAPAAENRNAVLDTKNRLTCSKKILDQAIGVISHASFNFGLARHYYPEGWYAPYRIIRQPIKLAPEVSKSASANIRQELGFSSTDFIITTFGHVAWTKCGDLLLDAFLRSDVGNRNNARLVFVGQLSADEWGERLRRHINEQDGFQKVTITGHVSDDDYDKYLNIANIAVQLRTHSRGGTPRGVLDCLSHGVPVIVNDAASYQDYPDSVVIKLDAAPSVDQLSQKLRAIAATPDIISSFGKCGRNYIDEHNSPSLCAAQYAAAIHEFEARSPSGHRERDHQLLARLIGGTINQTDNLNLALNSICTIEDRIFRRRRIYVDVSFIVENGGTTGIPRVVKETTSAMYVSDITGIEVVACSLEAGKLVVVTEWLDELGLVLRNEKAYSGECLSNEFQPGDILLMLDSSWGRYAEFAAIFGKAREKYVPIVTAIYDLLQIKLYPECITDKSLFETFFQLAADSSDGFVCISNSVAEEVKSYLSKENFPHQPKVKYWHLGSDFHRKTDDPDTNFQRANWPTNSGDFVLMVGTIEPRKCHGLVIQAMQVLWEDEDKPNLCIAGKQGWMVDELMTIIRDHPMLDSRLFFIEHPTDLELRQLYRNCSGLVFLSRGEGFGLPIVEAAHYGTPILCSDIPVFHEVAGQWATYTNSSDPKDLAADIKAWQHRRRQGSLPDSSGIPRLTWAESAAELARVVTNTQWL